MTKLDDRWADKCDCCGVIRKQHDNGWSEEHWAFGGSGMNFIFCPNCSNDELAKRSVLIEQVERKRHIRQAINIEEFAKPKEGRLKYVLFIVIGILFSCGYGLAKGFDLRQIIGAIMISIAICGAWPVVMLILWEANEIQNKNNW